MLGAALFCSVNPAPAGEQPAIYSEALARIRDVFLYPPPPPPSGPVSFPDTLRGYIRGLDPYSDYLTPLEYDTFVRGQTETYSGVGMRILAFQGRIVCLPFPDSPAQKAGIQAGDELVAVNDEPVDQMPIMLVGSKARGPAGARVWLTIRSSLSGPVRRVNLVREARSPKSVTGIDSPEGPMIRIMGFTRDTPLELKAMLPGLAVNDQPVIIDLRNNIGGNLGGAVEAAGLFLHPGSAILTVRSRNQSTAYQSQDGSFSRQPPLILLQNRFTASAAEVFIAALVQNNRAVSFGPRTYGKGVSQQIIELSDGSAMFITNAELIPPNGLPYHGKGLEGTYREQ